MTQAELLDRFEEHKGKDVRSGVVSEPCISYRSDGGLTLLRTAYILLGGPDAIQFFTDEPELAIVPSSREESNSYAVSTVGKNIGVASLKWLKHEFSTDPDPGRYGFEYHDGVGIVDFSDGPLREVDQ